MPEHAVGWQTITPDGRVVGELQVTVLNGPSLDGVSVYDEPTAAPATLHLVPLTGEERQTLARYASTQARMAGWDAESAEQVFAGLRPGPRPPDFLPEPPRILKAREQAAQHRQDEAAWGALAIKLLGGGA